LCHLLKIPPMIAASGITTQTISQTHIASFSWCA
jgi:hypothetical protein